MQMRKKAAVVLCVIGMIGVPIFMAVRQKAGTGSLFGKRDAKTAALSDVSAMNVVCAPSGIAAMPDGSLLVTDLYYKRLWKVQPQGESEVYAGGETAEDLYGEPMGGYNDSDLMSSYFSYPWAVAEFMGGWAVSDMENNAVRMVRSNDVTTINGLTEEQAAVDDIGIAFDSPTGLAADDAGNLYVSETGKGRVRKISPDGVVSTEAEGLNDPMGLCWKDGILYVAETGANRIITIEDGKVLAAAGSGEGGMQDGAAGKASFAGPRDVDVGEDGAIYVADTLNSAIRRILDGRVDTLASRDMTEAQFGLISPSGLLMQGDRLYICDSFAKKLFILEWK